MTLSQCIYCSAWFDPAKGEGDHIIPSALGEFRNDLRFRGVCPNCNNLIGRSEQQIMQCSFEGIMRDVVGPAICSTRIRGRSRVKSCMGVPTPEFGIEHEDHYERVRSLPGDPNTVLPFNQAVIKDEDGEDHSFELFDGMTAQQLKDRIGSAGIEPIKGVWWHCNASDEEWVLSLLQEAFPGKRLGPSSETPQGTRIAKGRITIRVNENYFRAIAKIAFHYYLTNTRRGIRGDAPTFDAIRAFIRDGVGKSDDFFDVSAVKFLTPFGKLPTGGIITSRVWCHILAADESDETVVVYVHMFVGPHTIGKPYHILLGRPRYRISIPHSVWGHLYHYDEKQPPVGYCGEVSPLRVSRLR